MKRYSGILGLIVFGLLVSPPCVNALDTSAMPNMLEREGDTLVLNGAGMRTKFFLKMYLAGLYVQEKKGNATSIIEADAPMLIRLEIVSDLITEKKMSEATEEGFQKSTKGQMSTIRTRVDEFIGVFRAGIEKGDIFDMLYQPGTGVKVSQNGQLRTTIQGLDFKKALFGIWLSEDPVQEDLKSSLLGN